MLHLLLLLMLLLLLLLLLHLIQTLLLLNELLLLLAQQLLLLFVQCLREALIKQTIAVRRVIEERLASNATRIVCARVSER